MHEHVLRAVIGLDEAEALGAVEKLYGADGSHYVLRVASPRARVRVASKLPVGEDRNYQPETNCRQTQSAFDTAIMRLERPQRRNIFSG
jgi:hypothetical protein